MQGAKESLRFSIAGLPEGLPEPLLAAARVRLCKALEPLAAAADGSGLDIRVATGPRAGAEPARLGTSDEASIAERARQFESCAPRHTLDRLILPPSTMEELRHAIEVIRLQRRVFEEWGFAEVQPFPRRALNLHGPPGTGKSMAVHALAAALGRKIIVISYAAIESKFVGEGPKNLRAAFLAAERDNAVLDIEEADSLASRRIVNPAHGSDNAINSLRSELLICVESFRGVVVFTTNLVENYDPAFSARVRHVRFALPDEAARARIWRAHLPARVPLASDVDFARLAGEAGELSGRDILYAVEDALFRVAGQGRPRVACDDLLAAAQRLRDARPARAPEGSALGPEERAEIVRRVAPAANRRAEE